MLTAIGIFFKLMVTKIMQGLAFMVKHWRVFLPLLISVVILLTIITLKGQRDDAREEYALHLAADEKARIERAAENKAKEASMKYIIEQTGKLHGGQLNILKGQYDAIDKQKRAADSTLASVRLQLRRELEKGSAARLPGIPGGSLRPPESWAVGYPADPGETLTDADYIDKLELGCAITTSDYNTLYERCEAANQIYGSN